MAVEKYYRVTPKKTPHWTGDFVKQVGKTLEVIAGESSLSQLGLTVVGEKVVPKRSYLIEEVSKKAAIAAKDDYYYLISMTAAAAPASDYRKSFVGGLY